MNEADEVEKVAASAGFFGGFAVEESPSSYHAPITDDNSGFGDIRDGAEAFPRQWRDNERRPRHYTLDEANTMFGDYPMDICNNSARPVLVPKSHKLASPTSLNDHEDSRSVIDPNSDNNSQHESNGTGQLNISSPFHSINDFVGKKRKAHDSFDTKSFFDTSSSGETYCQRLPHSANEAQMTRRPNISAQRKLVYSPSAAMKPK
jgi:hypothetical protein